MAVGLIQKYFNQSVCVVLVLVAGLSHSPKAIADPPSELPSLQDWAFDPQAQQLRLQTAPTTIPQYSRLSNPTRLIIDLTDYPLARCYLDPGLRRHHSSTAHWPI